MLNRRARLLLAVKRKDHVAAIDDEGDFWFADNLDYNYVFDRLRLKERFHPARQHLVGELANYTLKSAAETKNADLIRTCRSYGANKFGFEDMLIKSIDAGDIWGIRHSICMVPDSMDIAGAISLAAKKESADTIKAVKFWAEFRGCEWAPGLLEHLVAETRTSAAARAFLTPCLSRKTP